MNQSFSTPAIVIKRSNIGETDRLITLLTSQEGKIVVRARGVRAITSKRAAHVELFNTIKAQIIEGKGIPLLAQTELLTDRSFLKKEIKSIRIAFHLVEAADRLTPERERQSEVFQLINRALSSLNLPVWDDETRLLRAFDHKLARILGYGPTDDGDDQILETILGEKLYSQEILRE